MKIDVARQLIETLERAIDQAEAEGREELDDRDLALFVDADDDARAELVEAIKRAQG